MNRERWGTYSVNDHMAAQPFVADVLMYDRLVIPRPPEHSRAVWAQNGWDPDRLDEVLAILHPGNDPAKQHAILVTWDEEAEEIFKEKARAANIMGAQANFEMSRLMLTYELLPPAPVGVIPVSVVAAYSSAAAAEGDWIPDRHTSLTLAIAHEFLAPAPNDRSYLDNLKDAVSLADDTEFREKRARMYEWQEGIIRTGISDANALLEMEQSIRDYNAATQRAVRDVYTKFAFTLVPIALTALAGPLAPLVGLGGIANLVRFWIYDRRPKIEAGESQVAAMFSDVRQDLGWGRP